jgi:hypothetical protein
MEHILTECNIPGQIQIWRGTDEQWEKPNYNEILGISSTKPEVPKNKDREGRIRLYQIIISEGAHTIWKLHCSRVLNHENDPLHWPSTNEIVNNIKNHINLRLRLDCIHTDTNKSNQIAINENLVINTGKGILENEQALGKDWIKNNRVLVGNRFFDYWTLTE